MTDTLFKLLKTYNTEIPIVQRDYAQGRNNEHARQVRQDLLKDMKNAIEGGRVLDLNFIYGKTEDKKFVPLDGQQRLTTLFLVHLYAFANDDSVTDLLNKFTYETRISSREFLKKLVAHRKEIFADDKPSANIDDAVWYQTSWDNDPTVQSVKTVLDDIVKIFGTNDGLREKLSDTGKEPIKFSFLPMNELGMEDSIYIKMNARGRMLTPFENFKARLIGQVQQLWQSGKTGIEPHKFELGLDTAWTDLFWSKFNNNFDQAYLAFFGTLLMNNGVLENDTDWSKTVDYTNIDARVLEAAYHTLNYLCSTADEPIKKIIFNGLGEKRTYPDRVMFHAVTTYLFMSKGNGSESLNVWLRIIRNLTKNSTIDQARNFRPAIEGINKMAAHWDNLLDFFSKKGDVSGFSLEQITEEQVKARIINSDSDFAASIFKAEEHQYFGGQIRAALYLAKDSNNNYNKNGFEKYWSIISKLFDKTKPTNGSLLRRALLVIGDYTLDVSRFKTLCVDDPDEGASTPSLKRLFSNGERIVKQLLTTLDVGQDLNQQLQDIVSNSIVPKNNWRYCFVEFPGLFSLMSNSHLRIRNVNDEIIIVPGKWSNGYNYDIFLSALHEALKRNKINSTHNNYLGADAERNLIVKKHKVKFSKGAFFVEDKDETIVYNTTSNDPIEEATNFLVAL